MIDNNKSSHEEVYSVKEWAVTFFLLTVPIINLIFLIKWGFVDDREPRKSFIKGYIIVIVSYAVIGLIMAFLVSLLSTTSYLNYSEQSPQIYFYDDYPNGVEIISSELTKENDEYFLIYQFQVNTEENLKYIFTDIELVNNEGIIIFSKTVDTSGSFKPNKRYSEKEYMGRLELEEDVIVNQTVNQIWVE